MAHGRLGTGKKTNGEKNAYRKRTDQDAQDDLRP